MLNKLKVIALVGVLLSVVRIFFPELDVPEDFEATVSGLIDALFVVVAVVAGWFTKESAAEVAKLELGE